MNKITVGPSWIKRTEFIAFLIAFICAFFLFPVILNLSIYPSAGGVTPTDSLDPSYRMAISKANLAHLSWGTEFVLTYGPLSYLPLKLGWGINKYQFLFFDLFMSFNFFFIFYNTWIKSPHKVIALSLIVAVTLILPAYYGSGGSLILLAFLIYWIRRSLDQKKLLYDVMQLLIILLILFIKFNSGLIGIVFFMIGILYRLVVAKENKWWLVIYFLITALSIFVLAKILNVSLAEYMITGLNLVSGYNAVMFLDHNYSNEFMIAVMVAIFTIVVLLFKFFTEQNEILKKLIIFFLFFSSVYVLYKQAFVRADQQHSPDFFIYILLFLLCVQEFTGDFKYQLGSLTVVVVISTSFYQINRPEDYSRSIKNRFNKKQYVTRYKNYTDTSEVYIFPNDHQIPKRIKDEIKNATTDIYPWNTHLLFENRLNYAPRPLCQSYIAYTPYLENLNFEHYNSAKAPQYVFYEYTAIDGRYPLFDETQLNMVLLNNYSCIDTFGFAGRSVLLLKKNINAKKLRLQKIKEYNMSLTDELVPIKDHYYQLYLDYTLKGKIISFVNHAPEVLLEITTKKGGYYAYRTSEKLLETGLFLNYFIGNTTDFYHCITHNDSIMTEQEILRYKILPKDSVSFNQKIKIVEYKILR